ncbi:hypothetical protein EDB89DRAFT_1908895 [Lactarius sanguifluus]|nr:hypothetical protein EDB89DRAFT_1908895 [Lactarius sanguifluus]
MCPLLLTAIGLVTVTCFLWALVRSWGVLPRPVNLCGLTRCVSAQDAATPKARKGPIEKHGTSKEEIKSASYTIWDFFDLSSPCPHHLEGIGILGDGGKWVCGMDAKQEKCVVYSLVNLKERAHFFPWALGGRNARQNTNEAADRATRVGQLWQIHDWWAALEAAGLRLFRTESNLVYMNYNAGGKPRLAEYSFMNIRGNICSFTRQQTEQMRTMIVENDWLLEYCIEASAVF